MFCCFASWSNSVGQRQQNAEKYWSLCISCVSTPSSTDVSRSWWYATVI